MVRRALAPLIALVLASSAGASAAPPSDDASDPCSPEAHVAALRAQLRLIEQLGGTLTPEGRAIAAGGPLPRATGAPGEPSVGQVMLATNVPPGATSRRPGAC